MSGAMTTRRGHEMNLNEAAVGDPTGEDWPAGRGLDATDRKVEGKGETGHAGAWMRIVTRMRAEYGEDIYRSWFRGLSFVEVTGMTAVLSVPTPFLRMWIRTNYGARLLQLWRAECPGIERIDVRVRGVETAAASAPAPARTAPALKRVAGEVVRQITGDAPPQPLAPGDTQLESAPLDPRFRFDAFAVGQSNKIAHDTALAVASAPANAPAMFNPLFIHGGVGRGKTHLLHAIAWKAAEAAPGRRILHLSAEQFVFRFVTALRSDSAIGFKEKLRQIDLLLIDNLQFLQERPRIASSATR